MLLTFICQKCTITRVFSTLGISKVGDLPRCCNYPVLPYPKDLSEMKRMTTFFKEERITKLKKRRK